MPACASAFSTSVTSPHLFSVLMSIRQNTVPSPSSSAARRMSASARRRAQSSAAARQLNQLTGYRVAADKGHRFQGLAAPRTTAALICSLR